MFLLFHKNYYYFSKGRETARSPKPAVSLPLNPSLVGHGLRRCLKNLADSEVNSHYNKILVILNLIQDLTFIFSKMLFDFFTTPRHPELVSGSHFFSKRVLILFFLSLLYFYFFHKNYYHFTKGKEPARSPKPAVSFPSNPFLFGHGLGPNCYESRNLPNNLLTSEVRSVSYEQIRVAIFPHIKKGCL